MRPSSAGKAETPPRRPLLQVVDRRCQCSVLWPLTFVKPVCKKTAGAIAVIVPADMIDDWIETNAFNGYACSPCRDDLFSYSFDPYRAIISLGAGFGDKNRPAVARADISEE